jgi:MoaA/NifB/PqqE/SkfB family radical SAM enzyme
MCYQSAGPKGSDERGDRQISLEDALRVLNEAVQLECLESRVHISGGEAFLRYADLLRMFKEAYSLGYAEIGSTTNGFWAINRPVAEDRCLELRDAGVNYLEISIDFWHLPYVELKRIAFLLDAARATEIRIVLRTLSTLSHSVQEILDMLLANEVDLAGVLVANSTLQPVGRAAKEIPDDDVFFGPSEVVGSCDAGLNLTVAPNGNVYPCCAGADMTESLSSGNIHRRSLVDIVTAMKTDLLIRTLVHSGSGSFLPILRDLGLEDRLLSRYSSICHLCWHVFKDDEMASALRQHFQRLQFSQFVELLHKYSKLPPPVEGIDDLIGRAFPPLTYGCDRNENGVRPHVIKIVPLDDSAAH